METLRIVVKKPYEKPYEMLLASSDYTRKSLIAGVQPPPADLIITMFMFGDQHVLGTINQNHHVAGLASALNFYNPLTGNPIYGPAFFSRFDPSSHPYKNLEDSDVGWLLNAFTDGVAPLCRMRDRKGDL